jgi:F0F1-type ATP synthase assembly protein I
MPLFLNVTKVEKRRIERKKERMKERKKDRKKEREKERKKKTRSQHGQICSALACRLVGLLFESWFGKELERKKSSFSLILSDYS